MTRTFLYTCLWFIFLETMAGCSQKYSSNRISNCAVKITQGVYGRVFWVGGNQMPVATGNKKPENGVSLGQNRPKPVKRVLWVYPIIHRNQLVKTGKLYQKPTMKSVAKTLADEDGCFQLSLQPGKYSVFTEEKNGFFANMFDGKGNVNPVEVKTRDLTELNIKINYKAVF